ncbi:FG-GAP-like repeat-containing protein, partial [Flavobacterium weaverense]
MKRTLLLVITVFLFFIVNSNAQTGPNVTITSSKAVIAEKESVDITATLDAATDKDVTINFDVKGTALHDSDYTTTFLGKGTAITVAGGNGIGSALNQFNQSRGVFVDPSGNIYIADASNHRIQKWAPGASSGTTVAGGNGIGSAANQLYGPSSVYVDTSGNIYIADGSNYRIQKWTPGATSGITVAGGNGMGLAANQLYYTNGFFVESNGNIFVADGLNSRIQKWVPGATTGTTVAGGTNGSAANQLNNATDVFVDNYGNIYITDANNNRIQKWATGATTGITVAGGNGMGSAANQIYFPSGISVDNIGNIFIVDSFNNRIQKWSLNATSGTTVAGGNGSGSAVNQLSNPSKIFLDLSGNIFIADAMNNRIQKIQIAPQITIKAGETVGKITINSIDDSSDEEDETIIITPTTAVNALLNSTSSITLTLTDINDPPAVTFAFSAPTIVENSTTDVILTASVPVASGKDIDISFTIEGTATESTEYTVSSKAIKISAGSKTGSLTISTKGLDDTVVEILETIIFRVATITNATAVANTATLNLESDDNPSFTMTSLNTSMAEHESLDITATLQAPTSKDLTIDLDLSGTAKFDGDYATNYVGKGTTSTVAGGNGSGSFANQLSNPSDIFVDQASTIYVLDSGNGRIQKWEKGATSATTVVTLPTWINYFFIDSEKNIYISDHYNNRIQKWSVASPIWTTVAGGNGAGSSANQLSLSPTSIFVDLEGSIYIVDQNNNRIQKWLKNATAGTTVAGGNGQGSAANQLQSPQGLFVDLSGNVFIADSGNRRIQKWDKGASTGVTIVSSPVDGIDSAYIQRIFGTADGVIYFMYDWMAMGTKIRKWLPGTSSSTTKAVSQSKFGSEVDQSSSPGGIFVDHNNNIFIADRGNNRIQKIQMATQISIKAGETVGILSIKGIEDDLDNEGTETIIIKATSAENADITNVLDITLSLLDNTKSFTLQSSPFPGLANGSVAWGDYDRDGDLDVAIMGQSPTLGAVTALFENRNGEFVNTNQNFQKLYDGDISWIDINKDGWIDLVVSGYNDKPYTKLYINKQGSYFEPTDDYGLPQLYATTMAWGDLDNDGDIDLAIAGLDATDKHVFNIYYREDGQNKFVKESSSVSGMYYMSDPGFIKGDMKIVDVDLDGDNDLVYNGENASGSTIGGVIMNTLINPNSPNPYATTPWGQSSTLQLKNSTIEVAKFKNHNGITILSSGVDNTGNNVFYSSNSLAGAGGAGTEQQYPKLKNGDIAVSDYNIDGLNDIVFTGENQAGVPVTKLYIQDSNGNFKESPLVLQGLRNSTATWVDYDMDGDLDLFLTGEDNTGAKTILYKSEIANKKNTSPAKITGLKSEDKGYGTVRFSWDKPADDFSKDLSYVLRLGTTPGGTELSNTESDLSTGRRLIVKPGQIYTNFFETQLDPGTYYWSVQAVDTGIKSGVFSDEASIRLTYDWKMLNQGGIVDRRIIGQNNPTIKLADLDNDNRLDLIYGSSTGMTQAYRFDGKRLININNNTFNMFTGTSGIETGDVNGDGTSDVLMIAGATSPYRLNIYLSNGQGGYKNKDLGAGLYKAKAKIVDLNNDGTAEIVLMGLSSSQSSGRLKFFIYEYAKATQSFTTTEITNISSLSEASFDLGDVDKDGDVDFILSGYDPGSGNKSFIYTNDTPLGGAYTFTQTSNNLVGVTKGTTNLIDFDGDGDLDAVFTGTSAAGDVFEIYINKLNEGITTWPRLNNIGLIPMREGKIDLGDFNGDGYADLLYSGILENGIGQATRLSEFDPVTKKYKDSPFDVTDIIKAEVEFGDLDGDGDLDFSLSGESKSNPGTYIFRTYINFRNESAKVLAQSNGSNRTTKSSKATSATFIINEPPTIPKTNVVKNIEGGVYNAKGFPVEFSWNAAVDDHTPVNGLTYALKIGTTDGGEQIMSANANTSGIRKSSEKGNMEHNLKWSLRLPVGVYYWSVQAIDASYTGSAFSTSNRFEVTAGGELDDDKDGVM